MTMKLEAGAAFPPLPFATVNHGVFDAAAISGWRLIVVYRGRHCPICKGYLNTLESLKAAFAEAGVTIAAVSADPLEKAAADQAQFGWSFPLGHSLSLEQMRTLGVYISEPRSAEETDRPFAEPGLFVINPQGRLQIVDISNIPFARPDLNGILGGLKFVIAKDYPIRGTLA